MAKKSAASSAALKAVPSRRALVLLETGLLLGLAEGMMNDAITHLELSPYTKALLLMVGVVGVFAFALRVIEPVIKGMLKMISKLDSGGGALMRVGVHAVILFLIFAAYVRIFFFH
ncbi:MAG TPA: hypothetical protein VGM92_01625 [Candidatus Kapabacteria bacterium]|jgi:hypothetical protein